MYRISSAVNWRGVVATSSLDRGTKFVLLVLECFLPGYGTLSMPSKGQLVDLLAKATELTPEQVEARLQKAQKAGFLLVTTDAGKREWTLHTTYPRPAIDPVVNTHQDAVIVRAKTWEEAVEMVLEAGNENR